MITVVDVPTHELDGLPLRRVLPLAGRRALGPVVFLDHIGPIDLPAGAGIDVRPHPHIGLTTVSWLFEGAVLHADSLGHRQVLEPGAVNWMRAGNGIVHSERTPAALRAAGHRLHLLQCWIAASEAGEDAAPAFEYLPPAAVPRVLSPGIDLRVLSGAGFDRDPALPLETPHVIAVLRLANRMRFEFRAQFSERALYIVSGRVNLAGQDCDAHQFATLDASRTVYIDALEPSVIVLLGGESVGERELWWNFVASSRARIDAARARWDNGDFPPVPGDDERMPLPPR